MESLKKFALLMVMASLPGAFAAPVPMGGIGDGGGQAIVCRDHDGNVESAHLLDLIEAEDYYGLTLVQFPESKSYLDIAREYGAMIGSARPNSYPTSAWSHSSNGAVYASGYDLGHGAIPRSRDGADFVAEIERVDQTKIISRGNSKIPATKDSNPRVEPASANCGFEQVARYKDSNRHLNIRGPIWDKFSKLDKAALLVHEVLYRDLRAYGETTSDRTRTAVARLFAGEKFKHILTGVPLNRFLTCWTEDADATFRFIVFQNANGGLSAQFLVYNGNVMLSQATAVPVSGAFESMFGMPAPPAENSTVIREIKNPMIEETAYVFSTAVDQKTGKVSAYIEAPSLVAGPGAKKIVCNDHLTSVRIGNDGSVSIGPTRP